MVNLIIPALAVALIVTISASPIARRATAVTSSTSFPTLTPEQVKKLKKDLYSASSESERRAILFPNGSTDASLITYQFHNNSVNIPTAGTINLGGVDQFPALIGTNIGMAFGWINPCGLNAPHLHPRANEFLTVFQGELIAGLILEDNVGGEGNIDGKNPQGPIREVTATLSNFRGMLFPQGQTHFQFNPRCEPAVFAASFDSRDPGRTQIASNFFSVTQDEVLITAIGGNEEMLDANRIGQLRNVIPASFVIQMEQCAVRCGIPTGL